MKIASIKEKTGYFAPVDSDAYFKKFERIANTSKADIVFGPEFSFATFQNLLNINDLEKKLINLDFKTSKDQLLIPGTGLVVDRDKSELYNLAPILTGGEIFYCFKKTSNGEHLSAEKIGLEYIKGTIDQSIFNYKTFKIALDICRDYEVRKLKNSGVFNCDFHFILASNLSGVNLEKAVVKDRGFVLLNDGGSYFDGTSIYSLRNSNFVEKELIDKSDYFLGEL